MNCSIPGSSVLHYLPELVHVHSVCEWAISSYAALFTFCLQSFATLESFPMCQLFTSGGQRIGASASASVLPMNIQDWFPLRLTGLISLQFKRLSKVFFSTTVWRHQFFSTQFSLLSNSHIHTWLLKNHSFDYKDLCQQNDASAF